jgi:hypothetical protein
MCCTGESKPSHPTLSPDEIAKMSTLPLAVLAPIDPLRPLASSLRAAIAGSKSPPKIHDDGSIEYTPIEGAAAPPIIDGYQRDASNPWLFRPLWGECAKRLVGAKHDEATGKMLIKVVCNNAEAGANYMKFVPCSTCQACPIRVEIRKNPAQPNG